MDSLNFRRDRRSVEGQRVLAFTGEGAYHGSTKTRPTTTKAFVAPPVDEMLPRSLARYAGVRPPIESFSASFANDYALLEQLPVPSQDAIRDDGVTFCWCPLEIALGEAGPLTRSVLEAMRTHLVMDKTHVYVDSKIQYFRRGDLPVDSQHWHVDGSITVRGALGYSVLHDMRARLEGASPPRGLSYQSSTHCATRFATEPLTVALPELIENFDLLDERVRALGPVEVAQPAASIVRFDGRSLHRANTASDEGWRLWVRCLETDREVRLNASVLDCYGTVFRTALAQGLRS